MNKNFLKLAACALAAAFITSASLPVLAQDTKVSAEAEAEKQDETVSCDTFSVTVPADIAEIAEIVAKGSSISFYEKISHEKHGGFVGSIGAYENVEDYCSIPNFRRAGEIRFEDGHKLDLVVEYPSDVQFDVFNDESKENYNKIGDALRDQIQTTIQAEGGTVVPQDETDYTAVYDEILAKLAEDLKEKKDQAALEADGFSYLYAYSYNGEADPLDTIGYCFVDLTGTGYPELAISSLDDGHIYDMYAQVNGKAFHLFSGAERDSYSFYGTEGYAPRGVREEASGGADISEISLYTLNPMTKELFLQETFIYDGQTDPDNPYAVRYAFDEEPEKLSEEDWNQRLGNFETIGMPELTPLSAKQ